MRKYCNYLKIPWQHDSDKKILKQIIKKLSDFSVFLSEMQKEPECPIKSRKKTGRKRFSVFLLVFERKVLSLQKICKYLS